MGNPNPLPFGVALFGEHAGFWQSVRVRGRGANEPEQTCFRKCRGGFAGNSQGALVLVYCSL